MQNGSCMGCSRGEEACHEGSHVVTKPLRENALPQHSCKLIKYGSLSPMLCVCTEGQCLMFVYIGVVTGEVTRGVIGALLLLFAK
jgi:hypothetical protein